MPRATVLIVDDEPNILTSLRRALEVEDFRALVAASGVEALEQVAEHAPDVVLLDVAMPQMDGLEVLRRLKESDARRPVVMMSGHSTIETAVQATKLGAFDFVEKPLSTDKLIITLDNALEIAGLRAENAELKKEQAHTDAMIGDSAAMREIFETIRKTAPTVGRVLITGANGTGKELVARALHNASPRSDKPFIKVNCAAIPHELIESELFGHEKGAFTGATTMRRGKFEQADGGTLFLDEIGDMSQSAQAKVLRVLQENELERVGGAETIRVDVRVVAATNKNLLEEIAAGRFREDLYYRLNVVPIELPPLRERKEDIRTLVTHFLADACRQHGKRQKRIEPQAISVLMQHDWPGNVRELKNSIERLVILVEEDEIRAEHAKVIVPSAQSGAGHYRRGASLREMVAAAERDIIVGALEDNDAHVSRTAEALAIERSHLYKKMRALGIDPRAGDKKV
ncbi:MAG: sigma-54-dependent Fis family transcriptional regulator [Myxococcales bacterium]|nr:sigma-54-dependent Fis family transcriptional regulator [Myxococcales bacterium]